MTLESNERAMPFARIKFSVISALIGIAIMVIFALIASVALSRINMYEKYYTVVAYVLKLIPGFCAAKILSGKISDKLLLPIIIQTAVIVLVFTVFSIILNKTVTPPSIAWNVIIVLLSQIAGLFRRSGQKKKFHKF